MGEIRIGKVSKVDYKNGMVKVTYEDKDGAQTKLMPVLSLDGEYKMPKVDSYVIVAHLSNGSEEGVVLGTFWNKSEQSAETGKNVFRKELALKKGESYVQYKDKNLNVKSDNIKATCSGGSYAQIKDGNAVINADSITFKCSSGSVTVAQIISHLTGG